MADKDVDEQFAAIMAHWHEDALGLDPYGDPSDPPASDEGPTAGTDGSADEGREGADETPDPAQARQVDPAAEPTPAPAVDPAPAPTPQPVTGMAWRQHVPEPEEEHFVPPPPAPLPSADDKHFWLMMVGLIGGPLLFLYLILFNRDGNGWWMVCGIAMTVAGFVLLVLRQPFERDEDDDGVRL